MFGTDLCCQMFCLTHVCTSCPSAHGTQRRLCGLTSKSVWCLQHVIMGVTVTATTTEGQPLAAETLERVTQAAQIIVQLDADKTLILDLVQRSMHTIAPNLSQAVGEEVAARLIGAAGGLSQLAAMPACNVQVSPIPSSLRGNLLLLKSNVKIWEPNFSTRGSQCKCHVWSQAGCLQGSQLQIAVSLHSDLPSSAVNCMKTISK